jgi:hypothetical protein
MRPAWCCAVALAGCGSFELAPIELDVATNCNAVELITVAPGIQAADRPWHTVLAAAVDRSGSPAAWLLVVRAVPGGLDQLALVHIDDAMVLDREVVFDAPIGLADQLELIEGEEPGVLYVTQRAPGTFFVHKYDARNSSPFITSSSNLATVAAPCDPDGNGLAESCDASAWYQNLVFFDGRQYALTFPPTSADASIDLTPTLLDATSLGPAFPLEANRTLDFSPTCDDDLPLEALEMCEATINGLSYPRLEAAGLARDLDMGLAVLAMYREVKSDGDPRTIADAPLLILGVGPSGALTGFLRTDATLPTPSDEAPRGAAVDPGASYMLYTAQDGSPVLVRAAHSSPTLERLDQAVDIPADMTLMQLDEDVALHRVHENTWEILKLFPDAPQNSELTVHAPVAGVDSVAPAGSSTFLVHTGDGDADLVQVRCAVTTTP